MELSSGLRFNYMFWLQLNLNLEHHMLLSVCTLLALVQFIVDLFSLMAPILYILLVGSVTWPSTLSFDTF